MRQSITTRRLTKVMLALPIFLTDANNENKVKVLRFDLMTRTFTTRIMKDVMARNVLSSLPRTKLTF